MKINYFLFFLIIIFFLSGCRQKIIQEKNIYIKLPDTKNPGEINQWGFAKYPYIKLREEPKSNSKIINYIKTGTLIKIIRKDNKLLKFNNEKNYWYYIDYDGEKGWIFGSFIEIYNTKDEATKKCEKMLMGEIGNEKYE